MRFSWEIDVLSKAIVFPNLSVASTQVGLSQPQLSRILKKVEEALGVTLLDRDSKRNVSWKPEAFSLIEKYSKLSRQWEAELGKLAKGPDFIKRIRIACLEGVSEAIVEFVAKLAESDEHLTEIDLDVVDLGDLEKGFLEKNYDLIFTSRSPGKKKYSYSLVMGRQRFEDFAGVSQWYVLTPFEAAHSRKKHKAEKKIVTNSLWMKRMCIEKLRASGSVPSRLKKFSSGQNYSSDSKESLVYLIGSEDLPKSFWRMIQNQALK